MSLSPSIHARLQQAQDRHEEISMLLGTQEILANQNRFRELSMEYSQLGPVVDTWLKWQQADLELKEAKSLLDGDDAEMRELALEEIDSTAAQ